MQVSQLMTHDVVSVHPNSPFDAAVRALARRHVSALPVVDDRGYVVGILTEADVLARGRGAQSQSSSWPRTVREMMTRNPVTAFKGADVMDVAHLLSVRGWKSMPVTDEREVLVGVISRSDIIRALSHEHAESQG